MQFLTTHTHIDQSTLSKHLSLNVASQLFLRHIQHVNTVAACLTLYTYKQYVRQRITVRLTFFVNAKEYYKTSIKNVKMCI